MGASRELGAGRRGQSTCSCFELGLLPGSARGFMRISQVWVSKWLREGFCWAFSGPVVPGAAGDF